jgi:hypothetical protein
VPQALQDQREILAFKVIKESKAVKERRVLLAQPALKDLQETKELRVSMEIMDKKALKVLKGQQGQPGRQELKV